MSNERRERYAAAIWAALPDVLPYRYDTEVAADAAMAVADAEQRSLRAEVDGLDEALRGLISASEKDNNRRRAELQEVRLKWHDMCLLFEEKFATIERVRTVLDRTNPGEYVTNYSRERERAIRAALDGES